MHFDGANGSTTFTDVIGRTWTATSGPVISTAQSLFGGASLLVGGAANYIETSGSGLAPGAGDLTVDIAIRPTTVSGTRIFFDMRPNSTQGLNLTLYQSNSDVIFYTNAANRITGAAALTVNAWHRIRLSKVSGQTRLFVNGTQVGSTYTDANTYTGARIRIGDAGDTTGNFFIGNVDEFRYTLGVGRSTANYTPDTVAFGDSA
jgi:hypothetical protein